MVERYFSTWTIVPLLHNITCPLLAFQGENDEFGSIEQLNILKKEIQSSVTITEIQDAGHTPHKEAELEIIKLMKNWFEEKYILFNRT